MNKEVYDYNNGCDVKPIPYGCLGCPLATCKYDDPWGYIRWRRQQRGAELEALIEHQTVEAAAERLGITERSAYRRLHNAKL